MVELTPSAELLFSDHVMELYLILPGAGYVEVAFSANERGEPLVLVTRSMPCSNFGTAQTVWTHDTDLESLSGRSWSFSNYTGGSELTRSVFWGPPRVSKLASAPPNESFYQGLVRPLI